MPQIAVLLDSYAETSRGMLRGIFDYVRLYGPWALQINTGGPGEQKLPDRRFWKGDGIIAFVQNDKTIAAIKAANLPTVIFDPNDAQLNSLQKLPKTSLVRCDSLATGRMAAKHLIGQGFTRFAFVGSLTNDNWSQLRLHGFLSRLEQDKFDADTYTPPPTAQTSGWEAERKSMEIWLQALPKPCAIFVAHDERARQVLDACLTAGVRVPYEVGVLGVDNDPLICETCLPSLSSIRLDVRAAGFAAAEIIDQRLSRSGGQAGTNTTRLYAPVQVVARLSTEAMQINDGIVIQALEYIRINAGLVIRVSDVAEHVGVTPRWLEKRFDAALGRTVIDEIKRVRMQTILRLVTQTQQSFNDIARRCGFASLNHLRKVFRDATGQTMSQYRRERCGES